MKTSTKVLRFTIIVFVIYWILLKTSNIDKSSYSGVIYILIIFLPVSYIFLWFREIFQEDGKLARPNSIAQLIIILMMLFVLGVALMGIYLVLHQVGILGYKI